MKSLRATISFGVRELEETIKACKQRLEWIEARLVTEKDEERYSDLANDSIPLQAALSEFEKELVRVLEEERRLVQKHLDREKGS
jgi:predicted  nucleic acid-binding Zn-ribbon protein